MTKYKSLFIALILIIDVIFLGLDLNYLFTIIQIEYILLIVGMANVLLLTIGVFR